MTSPKDIVLANATSALGLPKVLADEVRSNVEASRSQSTLRGYKIDWADWSKWCIEYQASPLPAAPEALAAYISAMAAKKLKYNTIKRRLATISRAHTLAHHSPNPVRSDTVKLTLVGIRRRYGGKPRRKNAVVLEDLVRLITAARKQQPPLMALRDATLLLTGFAGAFRSSELVSLDATDVTFHQGKGCILNVRRSKTDQLGEGLEKPIVYNLTNPGMCAVRHLEEWFKATGIRSGPLFRSLNKHGQLRDRRMHRESVTLVLRRYCEAAGLDFKAVASHSLRAGHVTQGLDDGVSPKELMEMTGHKSLEMLLRYARPTDPFKRASSGVLSGQKKGK